MAEHRLRGQMAEQVIIRCPFRKCFLCDSPLYESVTRWRHSSTPWRGCKSYNTPECDAPIRLAERINITVMPLTIMSKQARLRRCGVCVHHRCNKLQQVVPDLPRSLAAPRLCQYARHRMGTGQSIVGTG